MCISRLKRPISTVWGVLLALGMGLSPAWAVDQNGAFELDGNAFDNNNAAGGPGGSVKPGDDWSTPPKPTGSATAFTGIVPDFSATDSIFTGGGSKTPNLIGQWQWKTNPAPPDKDNITNAYAANYVVNGKQVVYFGADLYATNGDAELAFWLFQDEITPVPAGGTQGTFDGEHIDEDVYVAVKFSNGGTVANIAVFEWWLACNKNDNTPNVAGSCAADNIRILIPQATATCTSVSPSKLACAISNLGNVPAPWSYTPKSGTPGIFPETSFFEGGINIFDLLGENKCFSSFAVTTGASTSFTATAKDFVLDNFSVCSVDVSKTCVNDTEDDDTPEAIVYNVRGCGFNDGGGTININSLLNSIGGDPNDVPSDLVWREPGQVTDGGVLRDFNPLTDCDDAAKLKEAFDDGSTVADVTTHDLLAGDALIYQFSETTASNGPTDTVTLDADGTDDTDITDATDTATCPVLAFPASMSVVKQCAANLADEGDHLEVLIHVEGTVCNTGQVTLTGLTLVDGSPAASGPVILTPAATTLTKAGTTGACTTYTGSYTPSSIPTGDICPFADRVVATAIAPINSTGDDCTLLGDLTSECTATSNTATCELRAVNEDNDCSTGPLSPLPD
jgi:hypothetical protein